MAAIKLLEISTLKDLTRFIEESIQKAGSPLWYRGINDSERSLLPFLFQHPKKKAVAEAIKLETDMLRIFEDRSIPYISRNQTDKWDALFLMQHFGIPTRLLDWTENPFIGLYFAIGHTKPERKGDAVLWVLNPIEWNRKVLDRKDPEILSRGNAFLEAYKPGTDVDLIRQDPVAMYGIHNSPRIVSQKGVFTVFGKGNKPMEDLVEEGGFAESTLQKIIFPQKSLAALCNSLISIGISESMLFPDLEGLAREIRRSKGFEEFHV